MAVSEKRRIAIVDDDYAVRDSLQFLLEVFGHSVQTFGSAVDLLKAGVESFAGLILDHHMPQMTGLDLAEWIRGGGARVPILLIIGVPSPDVAARATEIGVDRVLQAPPSEGDIVDFIAMTGL